MCSQLPAIRSEREAIRVKAGDMLWDFCMKNISYGKKVFMYLHLPLRREVNGLCSR